jgi:hypothetical protein
VRNVPVRQSACITASRCARTLRLWPLPSKWPPGPEHDFKLLSNSLCGSVRELL